MGSPGRTERTQRHRRRVHSGRRKEVGIGPGQRHNPVLVRKILYLNSVQRATGVLFRVRGDPPSVPETQAEGIVSRGSVRGDFSERTERLTCPSRSSGPTGHVWGECGESGESLRRHRGNVLLVNFTYFTVLYVIVPI